jgi:cathepsin E
MFLTASLTVLRFLLLAVGISANPIVIRQAPVSLLLARHLNITGSNDLIRKDQARAKNLVTVCQEKYSGATRPGAIVSVGVTNIGIIYEAHVGVGSPATSCELRRALQASHEFSHLLLDTLLIDTGSSNTWLGAGEAYVRTTTSVQTSNNVVGF